MTKDREPTKEEKQAAAAALNALNSGDNANAKFWDNLLEMTQEDNDKQAEE